MRTWLVAGSAACLVVGAVAVTGLVNAEGGTATDASRPAETSTTAQVRRGDLREATLATGALQYAGRRDLTAALAGTVTWLPPAGKVIGNGQAIYRVDTVPVLRLNGTVPAWRALGPDVSDGPDVKQLEQALLDLGYGVEHDMGADGEWTWVTTLAVEAWQEDLGLEPTGELALGTLVFTPGDLRVSGRLVDVGIRVAPATPVLEVSGVDRRVTVSIEPSRRHLAAVGSRVGLDFADGGSAQGRIVDVELVPATEEDSQDSLAVTVAPLDGRSQRQVRQQLEGSSVQVSFTDTVAEDVLVVPVSALVALQDGYAVEVLEDEGRTRTVMVTTGAFADSSVAVEGDLTAGDQVVIP